MPNNPNRPEEEEQGRSNDEDIVSSDDMDEDFEDVDEIEDEDMDESTEDQ